MKLVLDASIAVKWVIPEVDTPKALVLRAEIDNQIHVAHVPDTFPVEIAHALTRAERKGILQKRESIIKLADVLHAPLRLHRCVPQLTRAVEISSQARIGVYDCLYVALAELEQCNLVTADKRLSTIGFANVVLLANLP